MNTKTATHTKPYNGQTQIELIEKEGYKWRVRICGSGKEILVYEDEFTLN